LRKYAEERGVARTQGRVTQVQQDDNGNISKLILSDGREVSGDFFIDCSGFKALLIEQTLSAGFEDWSEYLPCDRAITLKTAPSGPTLPYTLATARKAGWTWRIPLQDRLGHGYVYASRFCSDADAKSSLLLSIDG